MQYKIIDESPWQILSNAMTIGPSSTGYQLQVAADGRNYTTLFTVGAGITRQITNLSSGSYFRMKGNVGEVTVNWVRDCSGGGGGTTYTAGEYISIDQDIISVTGITPDLYLTTADTQDFVTEAYVDAAITSATQDFATQADITAATSPIEEHLNDVEYVTATALTELHNQVLDLSGATEDFATEEYVDEAISGITIPDGNILKAVDEFPEDPDLGDMVSKCGPEVYGYWEFGEISLPSAGYSVQQAFNIDIDKLDTGSTYTIATFVYREGALSNMNLSLEFSVGDNMWISQNPYTTLYLGNETNRAAVPAADYDPEISQPWVAAVWDPAVKKIGLTKFAYMQPVSGDIQNLVTYDIVSPTYKAEGPYYFDGENWKPLGTDDVIDMMQTKEEVVATALVDLDQRKVESEDVHTIVKLSQAEYDLITPDPETLYIIINNQ